MKKISFGSSSVLTFTFLLSGSIIHGLYYTSGNPVISYICISSVLLIFTCFASRWFATRKNISHLAFSRFLAVFIGILMLLPVAYTVSVYAKSLGTFAEYYSKVHVVVFAVIAVIVSGICIANKGRIAVCGFARMTVLLMLAWIFSGFLGFFHTKNAVPLDSPIKNILNTDFAEILKNIAVIVPDTVILLVLLSDNKSSDEKKSIKGQVFKGTVAFIAVNGINMLKNVFMFGTDFLTRLDNPDLAAIRLIPMFELPEISVPVNTFAVTVRVSVYLCALFFMLKDAFGELYSSKKTVFGVFFSILTISVMMIYLMGRLLDIGYCCAVCVTVFALFCTAFFSTKEKNKGDDGM